MQYKKGGKANHWVQLLQKALAQDGYIHWRATMVVMCLQEYIAEHLMFEYECLDQESTETFGSLTKEQIIPQ